MSEEFRHASIGTDISVNGLDKLQKANDGVDDLKQKIKGFTEYTNGLKHSFSFVDNAGTDADKTTTAFQRLKAQILDLSKGVQVVKEGFKANQTVIDKNLDEVKKFKDEFYKLNNQNLDKVNQSLEKSSEATKQTTELVKKLHEEIKQVKPSGFDETKGGTERLKSSTDETTKSVHRLRDTAVGTFVGGMLSNGISSITSGLKAATVQGFQFASAGADVTKKWHSAGLNDNQTNSMIAQMKDIRTHADIAAGSIVAMQKKYLGMTGGDVGKAQQLTSSVTAFSRDSQMDDRQQKMLDRMMTSSKINAGMFTKTISSGPLREELVKMSGMTNQAFTNMVNSGKFTGQQLTDLMVKASKDSGKAWNDYLKTDQGKADMFKSTVADTKKAFDTNVSSKLFESIQKIVGNGKDLKEVQTTVKGIATSLGAKIGDGIGHVVTFITKNEGTLKSIGSSVWQIVKAIGSGVWDTFKGVLNVISGNSGKAKSGLKGVSDALSSISKHKTALETFGKVLVGMLVVGKLKSFNAALMGIGKGFGNFISGGMRTVKFLKTMITTTNSTKYAMNGLKFAFKTNPVGMIVTGIELAIGAFTLLYTHSKKFRGFINGLVSWAKKFYKEMTEWFGKAFSKVGKLIGPFVKDAVKRIKTLWTDVTKIFKNAWNTIKDILRVIKDVFTGNFKDLGKVIPKLVGDMWKLVKSLFKGAYDWLNNTTGGALDKVMDTFKGWGRSIGNFFKNLWDGIKRTTADAINGVTGIINDGIKGLNWILSKLGGSGHTIGEIPKVRFAQGTMDGRLPKNTMAMLNDGNDSPETGNKELVQLPNGKEFIPQKRNWIGMLPKGSRIYNATQTKMLMELRGIRRYGLGSFIGGVGHDIAKTAGNITHGAENMASKAVDWTKTAAGNMWSGAKKVANAIAHPIKFLESMFSGMPKLPSFLSSLGSGMLSKVKDMAINFFKKNSDAVGGSANPGGSGVKRWRGDVIKVLRALHLSDSEGMVQKVLTQINTESGGNPNAVGGTDGLNDGRAMGLMQVKPGTFAAYAKKGLGNWSNGLASIYAGLNYAKHRYGDNLSFLGQGHGYANGGWSDKPAVFGEAKGEPEVAINPKRDSADRLIKEAVNARSKHNPSIKNMFNNSKSSKPVKVDYHPTINISGKDKTDKQALHEALEDNRDELMNMLKQAFCNDDGEGGIII